MKNIFYIILAIWFTGCVTEKKCSTRYPCLPAVRDSVYIETLVPVDYVTAGDSFLIEAEVPCKEFELLQENTKLKNTIKVLENGRLVQKIIIKKDTLRIYKTNTITKTVYVPKPEIVKFIPKFWKVAGWAGIILVSLILAYFGYRISRKLPLKR